MYSRLPWLLVLLGITGALQGGAARTSHLFPQIGDGGVVRSVFLVMNQTRQSAHVVIEIFGDDGAPLPVRIEGVTASKFERDLPGGGTLRLATSAQGEVPRTGWARVTSTRPVGAQVFFEISVDGTLVTQAAVESSDTVRVVDGFVRVQGGANTGYALVNPASEGIVTIQMTLKRGTTTVGLGLITLQPGEHIAEFVTDRFGAGDIESGSLLFAGSSGFGLVMLQQTGLVIGSLPFVHREVF